MENFAFHTRKDYTFKGGARALDFIKYIIKNYKMKYFKEYEI